MLAAMNGTRHRQNGLANSSDNWKGGETSELQSETEREGAENHVLLNDVIKLVVCAAGGVVFGFAAEKGRGM